jgi:hypothetical protein
VTVGDPLLNKQIMELTDAEARSASEVRFWGQPAQCGPHGLPAHQQVGLDHAGLRPGWAARLAETGHPCRHSGRHRGHGEAPPNSGLSRVNGVCAGTVDAALWHRFPEAERLSTFERIGDRLPVGRAGKPEDIAEAYLYLTKTGFSTRETIVVDGGALQAP